MIEVATAFAPSYTAFLILRALFGIGMGGEWGVGASLAMEKVPARMRAGWSPGMLQQGYAVGNLLAALCYFFLFNRWGWRPHVLPRRPAGAARHVRPHARERIRSRGKHAATRLARQLGRAIRLQLEALPLPDRC